MTTIEALKSTIASIEENLQQLKAQLEVLEAEQLRPTSDRPETITPQPETRLPNSGKPLTLDLEEYKRYGRQMILPGFGIQGQTSLKTGKVLIVGLGGLGSPAAAYLAGAGVGKIGLVDGDIVEVSNLHRQIVHTGARLGMTKVQSAVEYLKQLNPKPQYRQYPFHLTSTNALDIFGQYDIILDCTDRPATRYLISDAAVLSKKLLITASATKTDGQLMTLGKVWDDQPCYRCVFPNPPSPDSVQSCSDSGILGPAVGVMGTLMAVETIKALTQLSTYAEPEGRVWKERVEPATLLLYSAYDNTPFRTTFLRQKSRKGCPICSHQPTITQESLHSGSLDYAVFCGVKTLVNVLSKEHRVTAEEFHARVRNDRDAPTPIAQGPMADIWEENADGDSFLIVDVREKQDFEMCHIEGSFNLPYSVIDKAMREPACPAREYSEPDPIQQLIDLVNKDDSLEELLFVCRYGNDSQKAVTYLMKERYNDFAFDFISFQEDIETGVNHHHIGDVIGGLHAWSRLNPMFPEY